MSYADIVKEANKYSSVLTDIRRDLHQIPEFGLQLPKTLERVLASVHGLGEITLSKTITSAVLHIKGAQPGPTVLLRADMDALAVVEDTGLDFASTNGYMHACGHDGHTAMLLAAAQHLATQGEFDGTLNLIFQPAEEGGGGALKMMEDGLFERFPCDAIFAMHNMPGMPQGQLVFRSGPTMASSDYATVTLHGHGGHGAMPHKATDVVVAAASLIMALQTVVSRHVDPMQPAVVTVGAVHAGEANNVIPAEARLEISVRALDPQVRRSMEQRIRELVMLQAQSHGVRAELDWRPGYAVLVNDAQQTARALAVAQRHFPAQQINPQGPMLTGSEDFAFMLERVPGSYLFIGNGADGEPGACMVHNPAYDFNDLNIAPGAAYWIALVQDLLSPTPESNPKETTP